MCRDIRNFIIPVVAGLSIGQPVQALAQETAERGICGQPQVLNAASLSLEGVPEELVGEFVKLERSEPRYIEISLAQRAELTFATRGAEADTVLMLLNSAGEFIDSDDDGGEELDSRLVTALNPGDYCLQVSKFGDYEVLSTDVPVTIAAAAGPEPCMISAGRRFELGPDSEAIIATDVLTDKADFVLKLAPGTGAQILAKSPVFDTYLTLEDQDGAVIDEDDDGFQGTDSMIELSPADGGAEYCIRLSSYDDDNGIYALSLSPVTEQ
ncbi:hypothetical protein [Paracoccus aerodenitrificans]|uniref:hypothetical protein n=1 Tax=Paracoccus aerodenitrificans TaxID=3017781 RepID=UPI0022F077E2|nr:hypothetical protein [Paracoccus aerodenitrificans]WBU63158.1 hypothetical protein PAE61_12410 [Paracoccus aerodenitrificans]